MRTLTASIERVIGRQELDGQPAQGRGLTDGDLVSLARAGDAAAFEELVKRHRGAVYRAALAAFGTEADAEDVAQEALVLAYRRLAQFRGDASVRTWMVSIAWRLSISRRRRMWWKVMRGSATEDALYLLPAGDPSPEAAMQSRQSIAAIQREIRRLPRKLQDALLLAAAGDLTQDEIAAALGIPGATFRARVRDARLKLKARLGIEA
jgi:RNA polymerase sigma-70 factor (ECF subfamily)